MNEIELHRTAGQDQQRPWWMLVFWLAVVFAVSAAGSVVTVPKIATWYAGLEKPWFTPPDWLFAPVWTLLYAAMAVAVWRIGVPRSVAQLRALVLFLLQLVLNGIWSPAFFGLESPLLGLVVIVPMVLAVIATLVAFWRLDPPTGILLVPYLAWVLYATLLNAAIYVLN